MLTTAEVRWFLAGSLPESTLQWFQSVCPAAVSHPVRIDRYLQLPDADTLGIKVREGRLEVKRMVEHLGELRLHDEVVAAAARWTKWSFPISEEEDDFGDLAALNTQKGTWVAVSKARRLAAWFLDDDGKVVSLRDRDIAERTCFVELSELEVDHGDRREWWTLGLEAIGPTEHQAADLERVARHLFRLTDPPPLSGQDSFAYPHFLRRCIVEGR